MTDELTELEQLSTRELHDRATAVARSRWDVGFLWQVLRTLPAAEAAVGNTDASKAGVTYMSGLISEALAARGSDSELQEALRPLYIDYLAQHTTSDTRPPAND